MPIAQLDNHPTRDPNQLAAAPDAIWAQYGGKFPSTATELTIAAATGSNSPQSRQGRSPTPAAAASLAAVGARPTVAGLRPPAGGTALT